LLTVNDTTDEDDEEGEVIAPLLVLATAQLPTLVNRGKFILINLIKEKF